MAEAGGSLGRRTEMPEGKIPFSPPNQLRPQWQRAGDGHPDEGSMGVMVFAKDLQSGRRAGSQPGMTRS